MKLALKSADGVNSIKFRKNRKSFIKKTKVTIAVSYQMKWFEIKIWWWGKRESVQIEGYFFKKIFDKVKDCSCCSVYIEHHLRFLETHRSSSYRSASSYSDRPHLRKKVRYSIQAEIPGMGKHYQMSRHKTKREICHYFPSCPAKPNFETNWFKIGWDNELPGRGL